MNSLMQGSGTWWINGSPWFLNKMIRGLSMCESSTRISKGASSIPVHEAIGMVLGHDISEIRKDEFKGPAFKKGHIVRKEDIDHLRRLGKENIFVLRMTDDD